MYRKIAGIGMGVMLLATPLISSADTFSDLQSKIQELTQLLSSLQSQIHDTGGNSCTQDAMQCPDGHWAGRTGPGCTFNCSGDQNPPCCKNDGDSSGGVSSGGAGGNNGNGVGSIASRICPQIVRSLRYGVSGDDVKGLQLFLSNEGVFSGEPTGFFGTITQRAVQQWQSANEIVSGGSPGTTGWGQIGPMSIMRIKMRCGNGDGAGNGGGGTTGSLNARPILGSAPLLVTFSTTASVASSSFSIDFGDGQTGSLQKTSQCVGTAIGVFGSYDRPAGSGIRCTYTATHSYSQDGIYTARLTNTSNNSQAGTARIVVGNVSMSGRLAGSPSTGAAPLNVDFTLSPLDELTGTVSINYGDGASGSMQKNQIQCITTPCISPWKASHVYTQPGSYTVTAYAAGLGWDCSPPRMCPLYARDDGSASHMAVRLLGSTIITVTGTSSQNIQQVAIPSTFTMPLHSIAEMHQGNFYMTLDSTTDNQASVSVFSVNCARPWPSSNAQIICMMLPPGPQQFMLAAGQSKTFTMSGSTFTLGVTAVDSQGSTFTIASGNTAIDTRATFGANPTVGPIPLSVAFTASAFATDSDIRVEYGDGAAENMTKGNCIAITATQGGQGGIRCNYTANHSYATIGIYTAKLVRLSSTGVRQELATTAIRVVSIGSANVFGTVLASPTCPVVSEFSGSNCQPRGVATTINIYSGTTLVKSVTSDSDGFFSTSLDNGSYTFKAHEGATTPPTCQAVTATVTGNTTVNVTCDSGIR